MNPLLKSAVGPAQGTNSAFCASSYSGRDRGPPLKSLRSSCISVPFSLEFHKLMIKVRLGENSIISIQDTNGCAMPRNEKEVRSRLLGSNSLFSSPLHLKNSQKYIQALKDGAGSRTCCSSLGHKVADKSSTSSAGASTFNIVCQVFQEFTRQSNWIPFLQPLHVSAKNCKEKNELEKEALLNEEKTIIKISSFLSSIFKSEVASDAGKAVALSLELIPSGKDVNCHQATLSTTADELHVSLIPVSEISDRALTEAIPLQEIFSNSFVSGPQHFSPYTTGQEKISLMVPRAELCESTAHCVTAEELGSIEALADWLNERLSASSLQPSFWGKTPGTKSLSNLWCELVEGEISLEDTYPPKRTVHVASVHIQNESGNILVEAYQEMSDGRIRQRNRPLSEKMRLGENVKDACLRGICEELGKLGAPERVLIFHDSYRRREEERESNSYPGLLTRYIIHTMSAHVKQLPATEFSTLEDESHQLPSYTGPVSLNYANGDGNYTVDAAVGVKRHFWKWI